MTPLKAIGRAYQHNARADEPRAKSTIVDM